MQVAKGARFHQLNLLHQNAVSRITNLHVKIRETGQLKPEALRYQLEEILSLPIECLTLVTPVDRLVMRLIGTYLAVELCEQEVVTTNTMLAVLDNHQAGYTNRNELTALLATTIDTYNDNSVAFEHPIAKTVDVIVTMTGAAFGVLSVLLAIVIVLTMRSIHRSLRQMDAATRALHRSEQLNHELARVDTLTGLPNRNLMLERLQTHFDESVNSRSALLFVDLDHFKDINDTLGHHSGDNLIRMAAERISRCISENDTVARIGGDEFNILLPRFEDSQHPRQVADKILHALSQPFDLGGKQRWISGSIGIAISPDNADNSEDLQKFADMAMYKAKSLGKNRAEFYTDSLEEEMKSRTRMDAHLRNGMDCREFSLHYQPVVSLSDMRVTGVEALMRWTHPELGMISPAEFIPRAEQTGLIVPLGDWALRTACEAAKTWYDEANGDFKVAVNVSPVQLSSDTLVASVKRALEESGLPPSALDIEITESRLVDENDTSIATLHELSALGVRLLLDDFGTGHSSLSYLHRLPFDVVKIDRSFISTLDFESKRANITSSIVAMAHELGLEVVAEGIEKCSSLELLRSMNCEYAQGYLLSRPVPADEIDCGKIHPIPGANHGRAA